MSPPGSPCFVAGGKSGPRRKDKSDWPPGVPGRCSGSDLRGATLLFAQSPHVGIPLEAESSPGSVVRRRSPTSRAVRDLIEPTLCRPVPRSTCTVRWFLRRGLDKFIWHMQPCGSGCGWSSASRPACGTWRTRLRRALSSTERPPDALSGILRREVAANPPRGTRRRLPKRERPRHGWSPGADDQCHPFLLAISTDQDQHGSLCLPVCGVALPVLKTHGRPAAQMPSAVRMRPPLSSLARRRVRDGRGAEAGFPRRLAGNRGEGPIVTRDQ